MIFLQGSKPMYAQVTSIDDVKKLFPASVEDLTKAAHTSIAQAKHLIEEIIRVPHQERTFDNTAKKLDALYALSSLSIAATITQIMEMVSTNEGMRTAAHELTIMLDEFVIDHISNNEELFNAFSAYYHGNAQREELTDKQRYFLQETMTSFKHSGLDLSDDLRTRVKAVKKELSALTLAFDTAIAADQSTITVDNQGLRGVPEDALNQWRKEDGSYVIGVDLPSYLKVMENCSVADTRKRLYRAYMNRAYPANHEQLKKIIAKRDELAQVLGFESYAAYDLDQQMVKTPERARSFLDELARRIEPKVAAEIAQLTAQLPESVTLSDQGKVYPWDSLYLMNQYKKKHLNVDEVAVADYFPMHKTIKGLLSIYESFFSLRFIEHPAHGLWHDTLTLLETRSKDDDRVLGYFILDLYPRPFKYSHACHITIIPSTIVDGRSNHAVSLVIANFPASNGDKPALLDRKHVETFFHEFGHALHALLGRTELASMSGTHVKTDFVEMPSQMLEEWLADHGILKMISSHYLTGEPLPDDMIKRIIALKHFGTGLWIQRQLYFARLSLALFAPGAIKDPYEVSKQLYQSIRTHFVFDADDHDYASFGHLTGYGAKYYGYMWSKVFALDLFAMIKQHGLLDPVIGHNYQQNILAHGGSVDPNILLETFLGRAPTQEAFLREMGIN